MTSPLGQDRQKASITGPLSEGIATEVSFSRHVEPLADVAARLAAYPTLGVGIVARVCRELQRSHFDPADPVGAASRYRR